MKILAALVAAASVLTLGACTPSLLPSSNGNQTVITKAGQKSSLSVGVQLPVESRQVTSVLDSLNTVELTVTGANWTPPLAATFNRTQLANRTAWKTFTGVQVGAATVYATAKDGDSAVLATASANVVIEAGAATSATLTLKFQFGDLSASINFDMTPITPVVAGQIPARQIAATYVGQQTCQMCHASEHATYKTTYHYTQENKPGSKTHLAARAAGTCEQCHATGADAAAYGSTIPFNFVTNSTSSIPNVNFIGVSCESCHGPGGNHVTATTLGDRLNSITKIPSYQTCEKCHSGEFSDGTPARAFQSAGASESDYMYNGSTAKLGMNPVASVYEQRGGYTINSAVTFTNAHKTNVPNGCVTCHMSTTGGELHEPNVQVKLTDVMADVCQKCHGSNFNEASLANHQTQTKMALAKLVDALVAYRAQFATDYIKSGTHYATSSVLALDLSYAPSEWDDSPTMIKDANVASRSIKQNWTSAASWSVPVDQVWSTHQKVYNRAYWNYQLVNSEGSYGVHAPTYTQTLIKQAYNDLATAMLTTPASPSFSILSLK